MLAPHLFLDASSVASLTSGGNRFNEEAIPIDSPSERVQRRSPKSASYYPFLQRLFALALLTALVGLSVMASTCSRLRTKPNALGRRLADGGDEEDPARAISPELELLCWAAEGWAPADAPPGHPRSSPQMVEAVLEGIEAPLEGFSEDSEDEGAGPSGMQPPLPHGQQQAVPSSAPSSGPPVAPGPYPGAAQGLSEDTGQPGGSGSGQPPIHSVEDSDEDVPGPAPKRPKLPQVHQPPPPAASPSPHSAVSPGLQAGPVAPHPSQAQAPGAAQGLLPDSGAGPSRATVDPLVAQPPQGPPLQHPYVRLPVVLPGVTPRPWCASCALPAPPAGSTANSLLLRMRELLLLPTLDNNALEDLMQATELLARHTISRLCRVPKNVVPADLVRERGTKFLVFDALHSAAQVAGLGVPPWWQRATEVALKDLSVPEEPRGGRSNLRWLAKQLNAALQKYKDGGFPSPEEVMQLKRLLFCGDESPGYFLRPEWQPWKDDGQAL